MLSGYSADGQKFCSLACCTYSPLGGFCGRCISETTIESPGSTSTVNFIVGTRMVDVRNRCPDCHSIVQRKLLLGFLFWWTLARYRVIYAGGEQYVGRRLKDKKYYKNPSAVISALVEDEGFELLEEATKLEIQGRVREAIAAYQRVADRYSHTPAGQDAQRSIDSLRAKVG
jgi:hypothetical protein